MVYLFLADGFEEAEALVPLDILRRGNVEVKTVGVGKQNITGAHGITVMADILEDQVCQEQISGVILPGGMPGTLNLEKSPIVQTTLERAYNQNLVIGAICAAPSILGHKGYLKGKNAVCFPGFEKELLDAKIVNEKVVKDNNIITAVGAGAAFLFGFTVLSEFKDEHTANQLKEQMKY